MLIIAIATWYDPRMTDSLVQIVPDGVLTEADRERADDAIRRAKSQNTRATYRKMWRPYEEWCREKRVDPLNLHVDVLVKYLLLLRDEGRAASSIDVFLAAYAYAHKLKELPSHRHHPKIEAVRSSIHRDQTTGQVKKSPITLPILERLVAPLGDSLLDIRSNAILVVGFAGGWRRDELVHLRIEHLTKVDTGYEAYLPKSKTDQEKNGAWKFLRRSKVHPLCPCVSLERWLNAAAISSGFVFRAWRGKGVSDDPMSGSVVARVVKDACRGAGIDPRTYSGHSLRAGFVTDRLASGFDMSEISKQTKHTSLDTVMGYDRRQAEHVASFDPRTT